MNPLPRLGLISAMQQELALVLARMQGAGVAAQCVRLAGRDFWCGRWGGREVVAVLSGIGKVAAAATAALLAERFGVGAVVFTGAAGGLARGVAVGDVVVATELLQHDMDASPLFPPYEMPGYGRARFAADPALSRALARAARRALAAPHATLGAEAVAEFALHRPRVHRGLIVSGDRFVATQAACAALRQALPDALAVEMEGAAAAQVCCDFGLPFAALRTISDRADDSAHVDFLRFIDRVASRYSLAVIEAWLNAPQRPSLPP